MTFAVTVLAPATGAVGVGLAINGTVSPAGDTVQLQLDTQAATLPSGTWTAATTGAGAFAGVVVPVAAGTWYVWAYDPVTGAQGVSGAVVVPSVSATAVSAVPVPTAIVASLLGGSAGGETPDLLPPAAAAADTDTAIVSQSGKVLFGQPFSAIWTWIQGHLPGYLLPQVTVATAGTVQLDNSAYNQRVVIVTTSGVTIQPLIPSLGPGFVCDVINASGSTIALAGITTNTGATVIAAGGIARILAATVSGTLAIYANLGGAAASGSSSGGTAGLDSFILNTNTLG